MAKLQYSVYLLLFFGLSVTTLYFAREFLIPLVLGAILAMLFVSMCNKLERKGLYRGFSSLVAVLIFIASIAVIIFLLSWQLQDLSENFEKMKERVTQLFQDLKGKVDERVGISSKQQEEIIKQQSESSQSQGGNMLAGFISGVVGFAVNTILVFVYMYLFLYFRSRLKTFILKLVDNDHNKQAEKIIQDSTQISQKYLGGLALMILMLWVMYGIGFSIIGVENALFFAILCGILEIVPFVGNLTGTSITILAVTAQGGNFDKIMGVVAIYFAVQFIQTYLIEPLVVGDQVNINPLFTILVLVAGELVWGIPGMVLAIPLLGIVKIVCDNVPRLQPYGYLIGSDRKKKTGLIEKIASIFKK